jgi:hypothetical protein
MQVSEILPYPISTVYVGRVCGMNGKFHLWPFANLALLWISASEHQNCCTGPG